MDYELLFNKAKNYAKAKGLNDEDSDEFAQECCIRSLNSKDGFIKLDWAFRDFKDYNLADKRILGSAFRESAKARGFSLDASIDSENSDSAKFGDIIADTRDELGSREAFEAVEFYLGEILRSTKPKVREWAISMFLKYLKDSL